MRRRSAACRPGGPRPWSTAMSRSPATALSVRLEPAMWDALRHVCEREQKSLNDVVTEIARDQVESEPDRRDPGLSDELLPRGGDGCGRLPASPAPVIACTANRWTMTVAQFCRSDGSIGASVRPDRTLGLPVRAQFRRRRRRLLRAAERRLETVADRTGDEDAPRPPFPVGAGPRPADQGMKPRL